LGKNTNKPGVPYLYPQRRKIKENSSEKQQHLQSPWHVTTPGAPLWLCTWDSLCHQKLLEAEGSRRSSQVPPHLAGERSFPWRGPILHDTYTSIIWRVNSKKYYERGLSALTHIQLQ